MAVEKNSKGSLEIICGSMFSGKSEELIRRIKRSEIAKRQVLTIKPSIDTRKTTEYVLSHNGNKVKAFSLHNPRAILELMTPEIEVVGIDEVQFFSQEIIAVICTLVEQGKRVIAAGLDLDFRGIPFGPMPVLLAIADSITKLKAICIECGKDAQFTQRLVNGVPARHNDPLIVIGAQDYYQARCRGCFTIDQQPNYYHEQI